MGNRLFRPNHRNDDRSNHSARSRATSSGSPATRRRRLQQRNTEQSSQTDPGPVRDTEYYIQRFEGKEPDQMSVGQQGRKGNRYTGSHRSRANTAPALASVEYFSSPTGIHKHYKWSTAVMRALVSQCKVCPMFPASDEIEIETSRGKSDSEYDFCTDFDKRVAITPAKDAAPMQSTPRDDNGQESSRISVSGDSVGQTSLSETSLTQSVSTAITSHMTTPEQKTSSVDESGETSKTMESKKIQEIECPVCFNEYPCTLNTTNCCNQEICTECFFSLQDMEFSASCPYCSTEHFRCSFKAHSEAKETAKFLNQHMKSVKPSEFTTPNLTSFTRSVSERQALEHQISEQNESPLWRSTFNLPGIASSSSPRVNNPTNAGNAAGSAHLEAIRTLYGSGSMRSIQDRELAVMEELMLYEAMRRSLGDTQTSHDDNPTTDTSTNAYPSRSNQSNTSSSSTHTTLQ